MIFLVENVKSKFFFYCLIDPDLYSEDSEKKNSAITNSESQYSLKKVQCGVQCSNPKLSSSPEKD